MQVPRLQDQPDTTRTDSQGAYLSSCSEFAHASGIRQNLVLSSANGTPGGNFRRPPQVMGRRGVASLLPGSCRFCRETIHHCFQLSGVKIEIRFRARLVCGGPEDHPPVPEDTGFESCIDESVPVDGSDIIPAGDARFSALTDYCDELHFHAA